MRGVLLMVLLASCGSREGSDGGLLDGPPNVDHSSVADVQVVDGSVADAPRDGPSVPDMQVEGIATDGPMADLLPGSDTCAAAVPIALVGGAATIKGSTLGGSDEFSGQVTCDQSDKLDGPQLYFKLAMTAGKTYVLTLTPTFESRVYVFGDTCDVATINKHCSGHGLGGDISLTVPTHLTRSMAFRPATSGTHIIAVDGIDADSGTFTLLIEEKSTTNMTCAAAETVTLVGGKATVVDTTAGVADEFGLTVHCGFPNLAYIGSQLYYRIDLVAGKEYLFRLTSPHQSVLYISGDSCTPQQINTACGSKGATGDYIFVPPGTSNTILFKPPATGTYRFAVDASQVGQYGHFTLEIEDYVIPANASCTGALPVALLPKKTVIVADTCHGTNEFGLGINCGVPGFLSQLLGSQLYYKVALTAGKTYTFYFTPHYTDARLYLFSGTCAMDPINADCGSNGKTGGITPSVSQDQLTWLKFTPQASSTYVFAVDNTMVFGECGSFRVDIQ